jgi:hypothetical protein
MSGGGPGPKERAAEKPPIQTFGLEALGADWRVMIDQQKPPIFRIADFNTS